MSHISLVRVKIVDPDMDLLRHAVEHLAREIGAELVGEIEDYYGNKTRVGLGIKNSTFFRGVGFEVGENGEVNVKGDFWNISRKEVENLKLGLVKHYTALATATALRNMGYQVQSSKVKDRIYIKAVAW